MIERTLKQLCYEEKETIKFSNFSSINYLETGDITQNRISSYSLLKVEEDKIPSRARKIAKKGQIVFSLVRPNQKHYGIVDENWPESLVISTGFAVIQPNEDIDPYYLYYLLTQEKNINILQTIAEQSVTSYPSIAFADIENLKVRIYKDFNVQKKIASLLKSIDQKIATNEKINDNLSQQCRTVFNFFFEQNHGQVSSKQKLSKVIKKVTTGLNPRQNFKLNTPDSTIKYITVKNITDDCLLDFEGCDLIDETARDLVHKRSNVAAGDILFSSIAPLGRCYLVKVNPNLWEINESVFCITPDLEFVTPEYLFLFLSGERIKKIGENQSTGSIFKGIRIGTILDIDIKLPSKEYIQEFTKIIRPLLIKRDYLMRENLKLRSIRDYLLPLLLNGQVKIR